jgi:hypothetical protein
LAILLKAIPSLAAMSLLGALGCSDTTVDIGNPLSISLTVDRTSGVAGVDTFTFQYSARGTGLLGVVLEFGDGQADSLATLGASEAGATRKHVYAEPGSYAASARAEEALGARRADTLMVQVQPQ